MGEYPQRLVEGLRLVSSVVQAFSESTSDLPKLLDTIATTIATAIPDLCVVSLRDGDALVPVAVHDVSDAAQAFSAVKSQRFTRADSPLANAVMTTGPVFTPVLDYQELAKTAGEIAIARLRSVDAKGLIVVPLRYRGELHGILSLVRRSPALPPLDELDFQLLKDLGEHASLAISNAKLFARLGQVEAVRAAEAATARALQLVDAIVENIPAMVFVKEADRLSFVRFNRAGEELLGVSRSQLVGKTDFDLFPDSEAEFFVAKDRETLAKRTQVDIVEEPIHTAHGTRWLHTKKVPLLDTDGTPRYLLGISEDITERKQAELELRAAKAVSDAASRELEAFAYSVAHDLRAPLRGIDGYAQALVEDFGALLPADAQRYLGRIRASTTRMAQLIDDLLALSRVTRGELSRQPVDLGELANQALARHRHREPKRNVEVIMAPDLDVVADRRMMSIAMDNLLDNAWKFTSGRPVATIEIGRTTADDGGSVFFIKDNGAGFDMTYRHKLFGVFQRLHTDAEFAGTGIGLVTVSRIVERHGGRVWAEGHVDGGATFWFNLGQP